jgi:hypothetical protein
LTCLTWETLLVAALPPAYDHVYMTKITTVIVVANKLFKNVSNFKYLKMTRNKKRFAMPLISETVT